MITKVEIFSQGEEVVTGQTVDSNAAWLSQQLIRVGLTVTRHTTVGDKLEDLIALLTEISGRADCCICSGGLGPTVDDLTAEAVSTAFDLPLQFDSQAYTQMESFFKSRNRSMPEANRKQAMLPNGATRLDNEWGTAPGFALEYNGCWFAFVPGVPYEMKHMYQHKIKPLLEQRYSLIPWKLVSIKTIGIGESDIQERLQSVDIPDAVQLGFRAGVEDVQTKLLFPPGYPESAMNTCAMTVAEAIGECVFFIEGLDGQTGGLVEVTGALLEAEKQTMAVLETISQGLLAAKCIGHPWLIESVWGQTTERLSKRFGLILNHESIQETAQRFALALKEQSGADLALVQLYSASNSSLQDNNQSITLYTVLATIDGVIHSQKQAGGRLKRKQNQAAILALDVVRRYLQEKN